MTSISSESTRRHTANRRSAAPDAARQLIAAVGGRFTTELGIAVDESDDEIERWFLAATLFGTRISASIAERTYKVLADAGVRTIVDVEGHSWDELVELLGRGGYGRYDYRTATRLQQLARIVGDQYGGRIGNLGHDVRDPATLEAALDALPGWGHVTVNLFLRELRGVWPGAAPPLDERSAWSARHLRLSGRAARSIEQLTELAGQAGVDVRDLEAALVRLALRHRRASDCPGGVRCRVLTSRG
jgi:endonuclease III